MPAVPTPKTGTRAKKSSSKPGAGDSLSKEIQAVYDQCLAAGVAVPPSTIQTFLPAGKNDINAASNAINVLLSRRLFEAMQSSHAGVLYKAVSQNEARRMGGMEGDEAMVYQYIKDAGDQGIWSQTLTKKTNLHTRVITANLKSLVGKSFIKCVTSVQHPTRKIYMLYDLTPSIQVSGGPWFTDGELDVEFVAMLCNAIEKYIRLASRPRGDELESMYPPGQAKYPTAQEIHAFLTKKQLTPVELGISDIIALLDVLVYDGKIERDRDGTSYKSVTRVVDSTGGNAYTDMPCGQCPVFHLCEEGGVISPQGCEYWQEWLNHHL